MIFGNMGNMGEMIKMAREMQGQLKKVKDELAHELFEETVNGVTVKISGDMELKELKIDPNTRNLEKDTKDAVAKALKAAKNGAAKKMKGLTGGMGIPGLM